MVLGSSPEKNNYFSDYLPSFEQLTIFWCPIMIRYMYVVTRKSGFPRNISEYISFSSYYMNVKETIYTLLMFLGNPDFYVTT